MTSLKRKQPDTEESDKANDVVPPPKKKMKTNKTMEQEYKDKRNKIIEESENKINILQQQIEKEKESRKTAIEALDKEFSHYLQTQIETIQKPDVITVHFESHQSATNADIEADFAPLWRAEFLVKYDNIFGYNIIDSLLGKQRYCDSVRNQIKLKNTFPELDIVNMDNNTDHFVLAKATFWVIQMGRFCNCYGLESSSFIEIMDAQCQELADLMEVMDTGNPGAFKFESAKNNASSNHNKSIFYGLRGFEDDMNEGGESENIIFIRKVEVNRNLKGHKLGRMLIQRIVDNFGTGQCRVVLKPFPLQWETKEMKSNEAKERFEKDKKKVIDVWESMGFKQIGNSDFWGRNQAFKQPMNLFE